MKKYLLVFFLFLLTGQTFADDFEVNGIYYNKLSDGKSVEVTNPEMVHGSIKDVGRDVDITSYVAYEYAGYHTVTVKIPSTVTYDNITYTVTKIGDNAFFGCTDLSSITIPNSVTEIGKNAFGYCFSLTSVTIPNSVTEIGECAFLYCKNLTTIDIPNSVTEIGIGAFFYCENLTTIDIPNSVTEIGGVSFCACMKLTSVTIPNSVTSIGEGAFSFCSNLASITIPNTVTLIGGDAFKHTPWYDNQPDGMMYINNVAYKYKGTMPPNTSITLKDNTIFLSSEAFYGCSNLTSVTIPNGVRTIGDYTFKDCSNLSSLTIPDSVTSIGEYAFANCSKLDSITIPNSVTTIGINAFENTPWYNNQPDGMVYINNIAYKYKGTMPSNTLIILKDNTTSISSEAFSDCDNLIFVYIPNTVTSIGVNAFSRCTKLSSVNIPNSVTEIRDKAFEYCKKLSSVTIPNSVTAIGGGAFRNCESLTSIQVSQENKNYSSLDGVLYNKNCHLLICCPSGISHCTIPNSVTSIGENAFSECSNLSSISIPNSVTSIGNYAFYGCVNLSSINIPNSVTAIGNNAFYICSNLASITIPNTVTLIGEDAFDYTPWYDNQPDGMMYINNVAYKYKGTMPPNTSITLKDKTISISSGAFLGCSNLASVTIPNSITRIGYSTFENCTNLSSIMIPNSVTEIGEYSFYGCTNLTSMIIPNSVTAIGMNAFRNCETLSAMTIPKSIKLIGDCAFANCINLSTIHSYIKDPSKTFLLDDVFYDFSTSTCKLYVPLGTRSLYQSADQWKDFMNIIEEAPNSILRPSSENDIHYTSSNGMICLSSDNVLPGVTIYDMDGKHVNTNNTPANNYQLSVPASGTYIMKIGKNMIKVLVK